MLSWVLSNPSTERTRKTFIRVLLRISSVFLVMVFTRMPFVGIEMCFNPQFFSRKTINSTISGLRNGSPPLRVTHSISFTGLNVLIHSSLLKSSPLFNNLQLKQCLHLELHLEVMCQIKCVGVPFEKKYLRYSLIRIIKNKSIITL